MAKSKKGSPDKSRVKALALGVSLSLAGAACAESNQAEASIAPAAANERSIDLRESEMLDVTLGSFHIFDREDPQDVKSDDVAWVRGCRGCRGCRWGCRGCRGCCRGCRGCCAG
jgi:hypothetical protein